MSFSPISEVARNVDQLAVVLTAVCGAVALLVTLSAAYLCWKYHATKKQKRDVNVQSTKLEMGWTVATFIIFILFFCWGSRVYKKQVAPVAPDYEVFVFAKQWMWKFHHPNGIVEVNDLHLPVNKNIRLTMISKDVIHSFFIPNLRIKQDVLPDMLTNLNFRSDEHGEFQLHCAEYCGSYHSRMGGKVIFEQQKTMNEFLGLAKSSSLADQGKKLFENKGCINCHSDQNTAPNLAGIQDDKFIRQSILYPQKYIERGYKGIMPSFKGELSEEELRALIEYIKGLKK
jgi:cytochrome c oxidase subunit 2